MTLSEAMTFRGISAGELAKFMSIPTQTARNWAAGGMGRVSAAKLQTLAKMLDGGVLITEDGVEIELYGGRA